MPSTDAVGEIVSLLDRRNRLSQDDIEFAREQIIVLDNATDVYKRSILRIDASLFEDIENINQYLIDVQEAYQLRLNVGGCRTDLFWKRIGYDVFECTRLSPYGAVGYGTTALEIYDPDNLYGGTTPDTTTGVSTITDLENFGFISTNRYGIKMYEEPYFRDVVDSNVGNFIGTIGLGSTILNVMEPLDSNTFPTGLTIGQLVVCNKDGVFTGGQNSAVGFGTTIVNLTPVDSGIGTDASVVRTIILESPTVGFASAPEADATFVEFSLLIGPDELANVGLPIDSSPYVPQTIRMMTRGKRGQGVRIDYDNSGLSTTTRSWNRFLDGFPNIDDRGNERDPSPWREPEVGSGKIAYPVGFTSDPYTITLGVPSKASIGSTGTSIGAVNRVYYEPITTTCNALDADIVTLENDANTAAAQFDNSLSDFNQKLEITNLLREDLSEFYLRIWAYRGQVGAATSNRNTYNRRRNEINSDYVRGLING
jgi:hypothetical protein